MFDFSRWHIEPTNRCTLGCIKCARNAYDYGKYGMSDIDPDALVRFWEPIKWDIMNVNLCGNHGDPLYHPELITLRNKIRELNPDIAISMTTNGSYRSARWWDEFIENTQARSDHIQFSIDGLEDTNHYYRRNCDWPSIMTALEKVGASDVRSVWKFIVFNHNQHQIDEARQLAKDLGITEFNTVYSSIWWGIDDPDLPTDLNLVSEEVRPRLQEELYQRIKVDPQFKIGKHNTANHKLSPERVGKQDPLRGYGIRTDIKSINPKCVSTGNLYISATNHFAPCCWYDTAGHSKSTLLPKLSILDMDYYEMEDHIEKLGWEDNMYGLKEYVCNKMCGQSKRKQYDMHQSFKQKL